MIRKLLAALAVTTALAAIVDKADAAVWMCAPDVAGVASGPRSAVNPTTSPSSSAKLYSLNARGCGAIEAADVNWFASQGFTVSPSGGAVTIGPIVGVTASPATPSVWLPARSFIENIVVVNAGTGSVSSNGVRIGTTSGGSDIVNLISATALDTAWALQATQYTQVAGSPPTSTATSPTAVISPLKRVLLNPTQVFVDTAGSWGTAAAPASLTVVIFYSNF